MTLYLAYNLSFNSEEVVTADWSNTEIPVLGVITNKNRIVFFQDEGVKMEEHSITKDKPITSFCWHPSSFIIAYGFEDGKVGFWIDSDNLSKDDTVCPHDSPIIHIKFNTDGTKIVSCDKNNLIVVWNFDRGSMTKLCQYPQKFDVEYILFAPFNPAKYKE